MTVTADRKLWFTADKESVVEDGDPKAAFLACSEGDELDDETAKRLGLKSKARPSDKQAPAPANKSR